MKQPTKERWPILEYTNWQTSYFSNENNFQEVEEEEGLPQEEDWPDPGNIGNNEMLYQEE